MTLPTGPEGNRPPSEFHERGGWYFTRLRDGSVRIRWSGDGTGRDVVHIIPANSWDSIVQHLRATSAPSSQPASEPDELLCSLLSAYGRLMFDRGATGAALERPRAYYDVLNRVRELLDAVPALPDSDTRLPSETPGKPPVSGDTTEELEKAIDALLETKELCVLGNDMLPQQEAVAAARAALVALYNRQREEIAARVYAELQDEIYRHVNARTEALAQVASLSSQIERLKKDSLKCTICGEPKICANGGCIGDD